jgi:hypothetical protein
MVPAVIIGRQDSFSIGKRCARQLVVEGMADSKCNANLQLMSGGRNLNRERAQSADLLGRDLVGCTQ